MIQNRGGAWLFSRRLDVSAFGGSAVLSFVLLAAGGRLLRTPGETPLWAWTTAVLLVDVAHVWSTAFRVYFDPREVARRPLLYLGTPLVAYVALIRLYAAGSEVFWRCLAYLAIFHFVRQQAGWLALYRSRAGERDLTTRLIDDAAIYAATGYPLIFWHTHARSFDWFVAGDLLSLPSWTSAVAFPLYVAALAAYAGRSLVRFASGGRASLGKDLVVATTAACWYVGIVAFDSDYAFTMTNVFIHGIPYIALIHVYCRAQPTRSWRSRLVVLLATIWALAYVEELLWDRSVWADRPRLFGPAWHVGALEAYLVPLLAVPQVTHYFLDGFIWRRSKNPGLAALFSSSSATRGLAAAGISRLG